MRRVGSVGLYNLGPFLLERMSVVLVAVAGLEWDVCWLSLGDAARSLVGLFLWRLPKRLLRAEI
jgi:hypothetical protein